MSLSELERDRVDTNSDTLWLSNKMEIPEFVYGFHMRKRNTCMDLILVSALIS